MDTTTPAEPNGADAATDREGLVGRFLIVAGLCGLAVAQPILDLLGRNPATFRINRIEPSGIVLFAVGVVVVPPLLLWAAGEAAFALNRRVGRVVHTATIGALSAMFAVLLAKGLTTATVATTLVGIAGGAAGVVAAERLPAFRSWSRLLSLTNPLLLALFLFAAPVSDTIWAGTQDAADAAVTIEELGDDPPSVIMLVFDEWATQSLLTTDGTIDSVRFPNIAAFAEDSTFYRHFSAVSPFTQSAVPALLDGLDPFGGPTWADHPNSLFSLLGGSHHPIVAESITDLCGLEKCGLRPVPPPLPQGELPETPDVVSSVVDIDTDPRWRRLLDTTVELWRDRVTPGADDTANAFDDFAEEITPATTTSTTGPTARPDPNEGITDDNADFERFFATQVFGQPDRHRLFVDALQPTDVPILGFLHLILPHQPWTIREDGSSYTVADDRSVYENDLDDPWPVAVSRQRHLLQAEYADRLLGDILRRLEEIDEYDDSIIVVVGDHGVAFEPGEPSRRVTDANLEQITYAPLFIKAPGLDAGVVDDTNVNSTDVLPTIATLLGVTVPWDVDGAPAGSPAIERRGTAKYIHSFSDAFDYEFLGIVDYDDTEAFAELLAGVPAPIGPDEDRLAGLTRDVPGADLIGATADDVFGPPSGSVSVDSVEVLRRPDPSVPLRGEISGRVLAAATDSTLLAAVNGRVVGVSRLYSRGDDDNRFVVLLPNGALEPDENTIRLALRDPDGVVTELEIEGD
ncbi:MAG: sulfatase-like hydrolase/transferase [Acidimicrobiales bacterium]